MRFSFGRALLVLCVSAILAASMMPSTASAQTTAGEADPDAPRFEPAPDDVSPNPPIAENVDLSEPVVEPVERPAPPPPAPMPEETVEVEPSEPVTPKQSPLVLLGETVKPGTSARLSWSLDQRFEAVAVPTPVLVVHGTEPGPTVCLTGAIHGDELNGIEIVRRVLYELDAERLKGTVIGVPIVNLPSFRRGSRYLPDRRDLNRYFPGTAHGSAASRIAFSFFHEVILACDALVDIHTGSLHRSNLPQLRADMRMPEVAALTEKLGATAVLHSAGSHGTLRRAAVEAGIPAVTIETGEPSRLDEDDIEHGTKAIQALLAQLDMHGRVSLWGEPEPVYYQSVWVRADRGGLLFGNVELGQVVKRNQVLGVISDPITNLNTPLKAPKAGRVLGKALNQVVMPGFAAFRIGIPTTESALSEPVAGEDRTEDLPVDLPSVEEDENS